MIVATDHVMPTCAKAANMFPKSQGTNAQPLLLPTHRGQEPRQPPGELWPKELRQAEKAPECGAPPQQAGSAPLADFVELQQRLDDPTYDAKKLIIHAGLHLGTAFCSHQRAGWSEAPKRA